MSVLYRAKGTGELAKHVILLGVKLENAYKKDIAKLEGQAFDGVREVARLEMLKSLKKSLEVGIGNNPLYTQKGNHKTLSNGLRVNKETGICQVYGLTMGKIVIEKGVYKVVKSAEKTLAKASIKKALRLRSAKFRPFNVEAENLTSAKITGRTLELC